MTDCSLYHILNTKHAAKPPCGIVRFGTVVINKNLSITTIGKKSAAKLSNIGRRFHPT